MSRKRGDAKTTKNAKTKQRGSSPYEDMSLGSIFLGRVPAAVRSKTQKKMAVAPPCGCAFVRDIFLGRVRDRARSNNKTYIALLCMNISKIQ